MNGKRTEDFEPFSKPCTKCNKIIGYNGKEVCKVSNHFGFLEQFFKKTFLTFLRNIFLFKILLEKLDFIIFYKFNFCQKMVF